METTITTAQDQFIEDYLLVVENDREAYEEIQETIAFCGKEKILVSNNLKNQFEDYVAGLADAEAEAGREIGSLLLRQLLLNWGTGTWDKIAERLLEN